MRAAYLRLEFIHAQAFVTTARGDYLDWHGIQAGGLSRNPATFATGQVTADGLAAAVIPDGTLLYRADNASFVVVGTTTVVTSPVTLNVRATQTGELPNTDGGATLQPGIPVPNVANYIVTLDGIIGGSDTESDNSFRQRILFHKQNPPHGGSPAEYVEWAQTKSGVTRVFVQRATPAPGSVTIYFMMDNIGDGFPSDPDVDEMQAILDTLAPADADVVVDKPIPVEVDITISNIVPDTAALRDAITAEIKAMFLRKAEPASVLDDSVLARAWIDEAVSMAPGWRRHKLALPGVAAGDDVVLTNPGELPVLGTLTFA